MTAASGGRPAWWQRGAIYQVYPRSFADSGSDGVGDLPGLIDRLDHLAELGVAAVWLSPINPSPMADFGYDVSDYCDVDPVFGTLDDIDRLVSEAHAREIRVVLDWVPNHSSDQHPWFKASRSSREDPKRDWYVWRDPAPGGGPPNDWRSEFEKVGGSWTLDEQTGQYYLHSFMAEQPDLNWENPEVRDAMHDVLRFWFDRGVDGLRLDAVVKIAKDPQLRDDGGRMRADGLGYERPYSQDWQDSIHERFREFRRIADEYEDRMVVGEIGLFDLERIVSFINSGDELHMVHNFRFLHLDWTLDAFRSAIDDFEDACSDVAWPAWFIANHDRTRTATRYDEDGRGQQRARAVLVLLYGLRGTPFIYQGEELGLPDAEIPADRVVDVDGRDPERAPIPWEPPSKAGPGAGFTTGEPWLPLTGEAERFAVSRQARDPDSTLALCRALARLRDANTVLQNGRQESVELAPGVLGLIRDDGDERFLVAINFGDREAAVERESAGLTGDSELVISSDSSRAGGDVGPGAVALGPDEAIVVRI